MPRREGGQPPRTAHEAPCPVHPSRTLAFRQYWDFPNERYVGSAMAYCPDCNKDTPESSTWAYQIGAQTIKRVNKLVTHTCTTCGSEFRKQTRIKSRLEKQARITA